MININRNHFLFIKFTAFLGRSKPLPYDRINLLFIKFAISHGASRRSEACEAVVNDDTVRRQSRRGTEHRSARPRPTRG